MFEFEPACRQRQGLRSHLRLVICLRRMTNLKCEYNKEIGHYGQTLNKLPRPKLINVLQTFYLQIITENLLLDYQRVARFVI